MRTPHEQGDAAAVDAAAELNSEAREPKLQCLPSGRGTTVATNDHDGCRRSSSRRVFKFKSANVARFITSQTVRFVPVRMVQDSYKGWLSTAEIMKSEEKNDANRRNSGDIRMLGTN